MPSDDCDSSKQDSAKGEGVKEQEEAKKKKTKVDDTYNDQSADLVIISSDNVRFYVQKYFVMATSAVFRDMIQGCVHNPPNAAEIHLTDEALESAIQVKHLLRLICNEPFEDFNKIPAQQVLNLIRLAQKWDCTIPLHIIALNTCQTVGDHSDAHCLFYYACALDNIEAAHRLLPRAAILQWTTSSGVSPTPMVHRSLVGSYVLDVAVMSSKWIDLLPRKYFLALLRASRLRHTHPKGSWSEVAEEFKILVEEQEKQSGC